MSTKKLAAGLQELSKKWRAEADSLSHSGDGAADVARAQGLRQAAAQLDAIVTPPAFVPQEVAFRLPGKVWDRAICKTQRAFDRMLETLSGDSAEIRTRDA